MLFLGYNNTLPWSDVQSNLAYRLLIDDDDVIRISFGWKKLSIFGLLSLDFISLFYFDFDEPFSIFVIYKIICLQELSSKEDLNMQVALDFTEDEITNLQTIVETESRFFFLLLFYSLMSSLAVIVLSF